MLKIGSPSFSTPVQVIPTEALSVQRQAPVEVAAGPNPGLRRAASGPSYLSRFFHNTGMAVVAVGLALSVGCASLPTPAHAQATNNTTTSSSCTRDAAWAASRGAELGRVVSGDANVARAGGLLAILIHHATCQDSGSATTAPVPLSAELQRLNADLDDALGRANAKYDSGSDLNDVQKTLLRYLAQEIRQDTTLKVVVLGHANVAGESNFMNKGLAGERAEKAAIYLSEQGIGRARLETSGASEGDGQNRLQIAIVKATAPRAQPTAENPANDGLFGIPGLHISIGGNRTGNPATINRGNGTVNGGPNVNGVIPARPGNGRVAPGPGNSGWNGN